MTECRYYEMCSLRASIRNLPPSCDRRSCWMFRPMPDVEALKVLADEMDEAAKRRRAAGHRGIAMFYEERARRIRDALGVSE